MLAPCTTTKSISVFFWYSSNQKNKPDPADLYNKAGYKEETNTLYTGDFMKKVP